ncbi:hypothetical protein [Qipengyuania sphaerica]|uniref:hypothetical protein n=1 Tax=Qipengyuania sphaerica TaxID=2867243 RepID=UPI001C875032|nr:hypothetical protein [Qipengyuania sphaerica]MBX7539657.1 hypothetical protein [Qipengyuania sphaerica]
MKDILVAPVLASAISLLAQPVQAQDAPSTDAILERLERLEEENASLRERIDTLEEERAQSEPLSEDSATASGAEQQSDRLVGTNASYAARILDHAEGITVRPLTQLQAVEAGELEQLVTVSGGLTVLANWQSSNRADTFGYLMRHPTSNNQVGKQVSEAVIHSAQLAVTARLPGDFNGYAEMLYDPQQSFGSGTITGLTRNQIQLRRGWVMWGNLEKRPVYALIGKLDVPFGLMDTVSPFTNSTSYHAFGGLAYGAQFAYFDHGLHLRAMAVQGGAQFRAANAPVRGSAVPSKINNFALDGSYTLPLGNRDTLLAGASYLHGSAYCQAYPVVHFMPCEDNVPAWAAYAKVLSGRITLLGDYASTTKEWPGSAVPEPTNPLSQYAARKTESFTIGGRYGFGPPTAPLGQYRLALSAEFSRFRAGADGAPWEKQDQWVAGVSYYPAASVNLFAEYIHVDGFVPLNFLSGGNLPNGASWSSQEANTEVLLLGAQVNF